ncbi:TOMM precursor leader peptide-binding protein [Streptomyces platensis]|uniref:TOMM precursor leader peptide-binding protein n=1 Tax=Streptomyces platensis TaxID=58346 RepID=UPI0033FC7135
MTDAATAARTGRATESLRPARPADPATAPAVPIAVAGTGVLASTLRAALSRTNRLVPEEDPVCAAVVTAEDRWVTVTEPPRSDVPWLPVRVELGLLVVGPTTVPGRAGCARCARTRRQRALGKDSPRAALLERHGERLADRASPVLTTWACETAATLVESDLRTTTGRLTDNALAFLSLTTMAIDVHPFLPDPACSWCGGLPEDRPPALMEQPRPKPDPDVPRVRDLRAGWEELVARYVDGRTGLIRQLDVRTDYPYPMVSAPLHLPGEEQEAGFGRDLDYAACARTALAPPQAHPTRRGCHFGRRLRLLRNIPVAGSRPISAAGSSRRPQHSRPLPQPQHSGGHQPHTDHTSAVHGRAHPPQRGIPAKCRSHAAARVSPGQQFGRAARADHWRGPESPFARINA